jgi:dipeptidyl aminopeptidase/acylaminoacyl peptidase
VQLSPDGSRLAYVGWHRGADNVWVAPIDDIGKAKPVSPFRKGTIDEIAWSYGGRQILVVRDVAGDENHRIHGVDVESGQVVDIAVAPLVRARLEQLSPNKSNYVLVSTNERDPSRFDLYRVDLRTGDKILWQKSAGFLAMIADVELRVRLVQYDNGSYALSDGDELVPFAALHPGDHVLGFDASGTRLYVLSRKGSDTTVLVCVNVPGGERTVLAMNAFADIEAVMTHPRDRTVQAAAWTYARTGWKFLEPELAIDFDALGRVESGEVHVASRSLDDRRWIVAFQSDDAPLRYYAYDRDRKEAHRLFAHNSELEGLPLSRMRPVHIRTPDNWSLVSYLSLPARIREERPPEPLPTVLLVHGGPRSRDHWGLCMEHQWLASRGYAVLSVNFRGSTGFGANFERAGQGEWGGRMQNDLLEAVSWAIDEGVADPNKIAIMGASYGGYAALAGLAFTPLRFACAVALAAPTNLVSSVLKAPRYWDSNIDFSWIGDPRTPEGREQMLLRSPTERAADIQRPLLIAHGARDVRVPREQSDQLVRAMREHDKQVTYMLFFDEGHGLAQPANRLAFYGVAEAFLAKHLGGRAEPLARSVDDASFTVLAGAELIGGLEAVNNRVRARRSRS